jgi:hypothetical protein
MTLPKIFFRKQRDTCVATQIGDMQSIDWILHSPLKVKLEDKFFSWKLEV